MDRAGSPVVALTADVAGSSGRGIGRDDFGWVVRGGFIVPEGVTGDIAVELRVGRDPVFQTPGGIWLATLVRGAIQTGSSAGLSHARPQSAANRMTCGLN